jgi:Family of unknown function (DUF6731)
MAKVVRVDFWDVVDQQGRTFDLLPVLQDAGAMPVASRMKTRGTSHTDFLADASGQRGSASGTAARIRNEDWPERANLRTGTLQPLDLPPDEAIAEEMSFLYDRNLRVLATQRHGYFRASALVELLCDITGATFDIQPKLRQDAWQRFQRMSRIGSVEIKFQGPAHHPDFSRTIPSMSRFLDDASGEINAVEVEILLSMGRARNRSLNRDVVRRILSLLRGEQNVRSLVAKGNREDEPREIVDFVRDRLVFSGGVEYTGRQLDRTQCQRLLREAVEAHRQQLTRLL